MVTKNIEHTNTSREFELVYNALSVGWHLRKIMELDPDMFSTEVKYNKFIAWLDRHGIKVR